jgi:hypothetical protein
MDISTQRMLLEALKRVYDRVATCPARKRAEISCQILERLTELIAA